MGLSTDLFIGGEWVKGPSVMPVMDPALGDVIAEVSIAGPAEIEAAMAAAHAALPAWAATAPRQRAEILRRAYELMVAEADFFAELIVRENGKVLADAKGEVMYAAEFFRWFSEEAVRIEGD